jgi:hypothetical protein
MASLRDIFSKLKQNAKKERLRQLARLESWLDDLPKNFNNELENPLWPDGSFKIMQYEIDIDGSNYTKQELARVAKNIEALHDICMKKDVAFGVTGFNPLPGAYTTSANGSVSSGRNVNVGFDAGKTYCHYMHPRRDDLRRNGLDLRVSRPRDTTQPEAEIQKMVTVGLSEKISVGRPLRYKQQA